MTRMPDDRLPKRILFAHIGGTGPRGEAIKPWIEYVRDDLEATGLSNSWYRKAQDRAGQGRLDVCHK